MANNIEKQLKEISERLEQGVKEIFTSERYTEYLNTMSKFHNYSFNNTLLITMQKPEPQCLIKETEMTQWKQSTISFHF